MIISEVLPLHKEFNHATVRNHLHRIGERLETELGEQKTFFIEGCPRDWENLPRPEMPLTQLALTAVMYIPIIYNANQ